MKLNRLIAAIAATAAITAAAQVKPGVEVLRDGGFAPLLSYTLQLKFWKICAILYLRDVMC